MFVVVTTLVMLFKHEMEATTHDEEDVLEESALTQSVWEAYMQLWRIVHLPAVLSLIAMLMTYKVKC